MYNSGQLTRKCLKILLIWIAVNFPVEGFPSNLSVYMQNIITTSVCTQNEHTWVIRCFERDISAARFFMLGPPGRFIGCINPKIGIMPSYKVGISI